MINESIKPNSAAYSGYYEMARLQLLDLLAYGKPPQQVLEIGCAAGVNLAVLKRRFPLCSTTGVELRADAAELARVRGGVDEMRVADLSLNVQHLFAPSTFDLIIMSHVLEHFAQPQSVLTQTLGWLKPGGQVLVALPNVRHVSVLWDLVLNGEFRYMPSGILDQTHLRFFTRKSAERMLHEAGLRVIRAEPEFGGGKSILLNRLSLGLAEDFAAYAYNFLAVKP